MSLRKALLLALFFCHRPSITIPCRVHYVLFSIAPNSTICICTRLTNVYEYETVIGIYHGHQHYGGKFLVVVISRTGNLLAPLKTRTFHPQCHSNVAYSIWQGNLQILTVGLLIIILQDVGNANFDDLADGVISNADFESQINVRHSRNLAAELHLWGQGQPTGRCLHQKWRHVLEENFILLNRKAHVSFKGRRLPGIQLWQKESLDCGIILSQTDLFFISFLALSLLSC